MAETRSGFQVVRMKATMAPSSRAMMTAATHGACSVKKAGDQSQFRTRAAIQIRSAGPGVRRTHVRQPATAMAT